MSANRPPSIVPLDPLGEMPFLKRRKGQDLALRVAPQSCRPTIAVLLLVLFSFLLATSRAEAQLAKLLQRPTAIQNARILTMDGSVIEEGTLVIKGEKIVAVGADVKAPLLARKIDATGQTITPGFIDVYSALGRSGGGGGSTMRRAEDAFDRYDTADLQEALSQGVTAVYLSPGSAAGPLGTGAIVRLAPQPDGQGGLGRVLKSEAALCFSLGSEDRPVSRLKTLAAVEKLFRDALDHRQALEDYQEDVKAYEKDLKQWLAKKEKEAKAKKEGEKPGTDAKPAPKMAAAEGKPEGEKDKAAKEEEGKSEPKDGKPKKPKRPPRRPDLDMVLRALDRQMPVLIVANRSEDILNALELAEKYSFDLILEGGAEAHLVAEPLAKAKALVILDGTPRDSVRRDDVYRRASTRAGEVLSATGVPWVVGSGAASPAEARFVAMISQLADARSGPESPLDLITARAAEALRVADRIGRLRPGMLADVVLWSGDPLDPASKVQRVYVGGALVFESVEAPNKGSAHEDAS
jgi:imidazolonepropionase-like amidohydrolase